MKLPFSILIEQVGKVGLPEAAVRPLATMIATIRPFSYPTGFASVCNRARKVLAELRAFYREMPLEEQSDYNAEEAAAAAAYAEDLAALADDDLKPYREWLKRRPEPIDPAFEGIEAPPDPIPDYHGFVRRLDDLMLRIPHGNVQARDPIPAPAFFGPIHTRLGTTYQRFLMVQVGWLLEAHGVDRTERLRVVGETLRIAGVWAKIPDTESLNTQYTRAEKAIAEEIARSQLQELCNATTIAKMWEKRASCWKDDAAWSPPNPNARWITDLSKDLFL